MGNAKKISCRCGCVKAFRSWKFDSRSRHWECARCGFNHGRC